MWECEFEGTTQSRDLDNLNQICIAITNLTDFVVWKDWSLVNKCYLKIVFPALEYYFCAIACIGMVETLHIFTVPFQRHDKTFALTSVTNLCKYKTFMVILTWDQPRLLSNQHLYCCSDRWSLDLVNFSSVIDVSICSLFGSDSWSPLLCTIYKNNDVDDNAISIQHRLW